MKYCVVSNTNVALKAALFATASVMCLTLSKSTARAQDITQTNTLDLHTSNDTIQLITGAGAVTLTNTGHLISDNYSTIWTRNYDTSTVSVTNYGTLEPYYTGIASLTDAGTISIKNFAEITSTASFGIYAQNFQSTALGVTIENSGKIDAVAEAIYSEVEGGPVEITTSNTLTSSSENAIEVRTGGGSVTIHNAGILSAYDNGIEVVSQGSGTISVTQTAGSITSDHSSAISIAGLGNLVVQIDGGSITGSSAGAAINFGKLDGTLYGSSNTLTNSGTIQNSGGIDYLAVLGHDGNEDITNNGIIASNVDLGSGSNSLLNDTGGQFRPGSIVSIGAGNTFTNSGVLSPGGDGTIQTTSVAGTFIQTSTGSYLVDLDGGASDRLAISGTATFSGYVIPNVISLASPSGSILIATASMISSTASAIDTPTENFELVVENGNQLWLSWNLTPASILSAVTGPLTPNQHSVAVYLDAIAASGPTASVQPLIDAIRGLPSDQAILDALDRLHAEHYLAQLQDTIFANLSFLDSVKSCPVIGQNGSGIAEGQCYWARLSAYEYDWSQTRSSVGGHSSGSAVTAGIQVALEDNWRLGTAVSYGSTNVKTDNSASSEGDRLEVAAIIKNRWENLSASASVFGGYAWFDTTRSFNLGGLDVVTGDHKIAFGGSDIRLAYQIDVEQIYIRPMLDITATLFDYGDFTENGGAPALHNERQRDALITLTPALQIGTSLAGPKDTTIRAFVRLGATFLEDTEFRLTSSFINAQAGDASFTTTTEMDRTYLNVSAGAEFFALRGWEFKASYDGRFSESTEIHSGSIKAINRF